MYLYNNDFSGWFKVWRPVGGSDPRVENLSAGKPGNNLLSRGGERKVMAIVSVFFISGSKGAKVIFDFEENFPF